MITRRNLCIALAGTSTLTVWKKPIVKAINLPAHAAMTASMDQAALLTIGPFTKACTARDSRTYYSIKVDESGSQPMAIVDEIPEVNTDSIPVSPDGTFILAYTSQSTGSNVINFSEVNTRTLLITYFITMESGVYFNNGTSVEQKILSHFTRSGLSCKTRFDSFDSSFVELTITGSRGGKYAINLFGTAIQAPPIGIGISQARFFPLSDLAFPLFALDFNSYSLSLIC